MKNDVTEVLLFLCVCVCVCCFWTIFTELLPSNDRCEYTYRHAGFPLTRRGPYRRRRVQHFFYSYVCILCRGNVLTEMLLSEYIGIHIEGTLLEPLLWFSGVNGNTKTKWWCYRPNLFLQNKGSMLKYNILFLLKPTNITMSSTEMTNNLWRIWPFARQRLGKHCLELIYHYSVTKDFTYIWI
jgi:hypothetical protein